MRKLCSLAYAWSSTFMGDATQGRHVKLPLGGTWKSKGALAKVPQLYPSLPYCPLVLLSKPPSIQRCQLHYPTGKPHEGKDITLSKTLLFWQCY